MRITSLLVEVPERKGVRHLIPDSSDSCSTLSHFHCKPDAFRYLQGLYDPEQALRRRVATWSEHALEAFAGLIESFREAVERDRRVDIVTQHRLAGFEIAGQQFVDRLDQHRFADASVILGTRPNGFAKFVCDRHSDPNPVVFLSFCSGDITPVSRGRRTSPPSRLLSAMAREAQ